MMYLCVLLVLSVAVVAPLATAYPLNFGNYPFDIDYGTDLLDVDVQAGPLCNGARFLTTWPCDRYCNYPVYDYPCGLYPAAYGGYVGGSNIEVSQDNYVQNTYYGDIDMQNTRNNIVAYGPSRFNFDQVSERVIPFRRQYPGDIIVERGDRSVNIQYPGDFVVERERPSTSVRLGGNFFPFLRKYSAEQEGEFPRYYTSKSLEQFKTPRNNVKVSQDDYIQNTYYGDTNIQNTRNNIVAYGPSRFNFDQVAERVIPFRRQYPGDIIVERGDRSANIQYPGDIVVERERPSTSVRLGGNYFPFLRK